MLQAITRILVLLISVFLISSLSQASEHEFRRPDFSMADLQGVERSINEWDGKALILNFWASWCIPCKREIPMLNEVSNSYADNDIEVLGVAVDSHENIREFVANTPLDYETLVDEDKAQDLAHQITNSFLVLPFTVFIDHEGRIFWMQVEEVHRYEVDAIMNRIIQIKNGEMDFDQAQNALVADLEQLYQQQTAE